VWDRVRHPDHDWGGGTGEGLEIRRKKMKKNIQVMVEKHAAGWGGTKAQNKSIPLQMVFVTGKKSPNERKGKSTGSFELPQVHGLEELAEIRLSGKSF